MRSYGATPTGMLVSIVLASIAGLAFWRYDCATEDEGRIASRGKRCQ